MTNPSRDERTRSCNEGEGGSTCHTVDTPPTGSWYSDPATQTERNAGDESPS